MSKLSIDTKIIFCSRHVYFAVKFAILPLGAMGIQVLLEQASSGNLRNCNYWHSSWLHLSAPEVSALSCKSGKIK